MSTLMPDNVDCFNYQYNTCTRSNCPYQHRELARQSNMICCMWMWYKQCQNQQCTRKHLNEETMKQFFHCKSEQEGACNDVFCESYHEKPRSILFNGQNIRKEPNQVPLEEESMTRIMKEALIDYLHKLTLMMSSYIFIMKSLQFILTKCKSGKLTREQADHYMKEILHTIFFIGYINKLPVSPDDVLQENVASKLRQKFPDAFEMYRSQLPLRTPYSVLLDVVVETTEVPECEGDRRVCAVLDTLLDFNTKMYLPRFLLFGNRICEFLNAKKVCGNDFSLSSTVVSYCYFEDCETKQATNKHFGASLSCKGRQQSEIFIDLSCIHTWNRNVALAVCSAADKRDSVSLPKTVYSAAFHMKSDKNCWLENLISQLLQRLTSGSMMTWKNFNNFSEFRDFLEKTQILSKDEDKIRRYLFSHQTSVSPRSERFKYDPKPPCQRCLEIFPDIKCDPLPKDHPNSPSWEYGNCAECEAVSKLLNAESGVNDRVSMPSSFNIPVPPPDEPLCETLITSRRQRLADNLRKVKFEVGNHFQFYHP